MKKWQNTKQNKLNSNSQSSRRSARSLRRLSQRFARPHSSKQLLWSNKRCSSAGGLNTSPAGAVTSLILITALSSPAISSNAYAADSTLTLSLDSSTVSIDMGTVNSNGTFAESSTPNTIGVTTTNATGYTLAVKSTNATNDANKYLVNSNGECASTPTAEGCRLTSVTGATTKEVFSSVANKDTYNGKWGYLPSKYYNSATKTTIDNTGSNPSFLPAPDATGSIMDVTTTANSTANEYTIAIGARVDTSYKLGAYTNDAFVILVTANAIPYTVTYIDNVVGDMPVDVNTTVEQGATANVSSNTPTRTGYTFLGWCTTTPTINSNGTDTCSGTQYSAGAALPVSTAQGANNDFTLYAIWQEMTNYCKGSAYGCMQELSTANCPTTAMELIDGRDGSLYRIQKLADNNCWMTSNLNLAGGTTLTPYLSNVSNDFTLPASSLSGFDSATPIAEVYTSNSTDCTAASGCYSYYSYVAACAGENPTSDTCTQDICPKNWRLPTASEYTGLITAYPSYDSLMNAPFSGTPNGWLVSSQVRGNGSTSAGTYWASTAYSANVARNLFFSTHGVEVEVAGKVHGRAVRCLLR